MGSVVAVVLIKERHIVEAFENVGATTAERARTLDELGNVGVHAHGLAWHALRDRLIVREAGAGRYYADVELWQATRRRRRRAAFAVLTIAALISAGLWLSKGQLRR
jgi:hypothetical protein